MKDGGRGHRRPLEGRYDEWRSAMAARKRRGACVNNLSVILAPATIIREKRPR